MADPFSLARILPCGRVPLAVGPEGLLHLLPVGLGAVQSQLRCGPGNIPLSSKQHVHRVLLAAWLHAHWEN